MLARINDLLPQTLLDSENFNKASSQFKTTTLDVTDLTPLNSAKHLLASIQRTRQALEDAQSNLKRKYLKVRKLKAKLEKEVNPLKQEALEIDLSEAENHIANIEATVRGAIRKLHFSMTQYQSILDHLGVDCITEEMYENDQARYHILTAFNQALTAARARGGIIDEGNHIYLFQLGINGAVAQAEVSWLLEREQDLLAEGKAPTHQMVLNWLHACADKYENDARDYAEKRGLTTLDYTSMLKELSG